SGEYIIRRDITSRLSQLTFSFDADARLIAGWLAYAQGVAAAPTGTQVAEVWTLTVTGTLTAGTFKILHTNEGISDTVDIPYNATAAEIKVLLESLRTIKKGNVLVSGSLPAGPIVITGTGKLAAGNISVATINNAALTGGTVAIATTTPGTSKTVAITRTTLDQTPLFSLIVGFEDDTTVPDIYKDCVVNSVTIRGALRGKVTVELSILGSADVIQTLAYTLPDCVNIDPIYTRDCRLVVDGTFLIEDLREFSYVFSNNVFSGEDAFPYDDIDITRLEHGDRTSSFVFSIYGSKGDTIYNLAELETPVPVRLILGAPVERVEINAPKTSLVLDENPITFAGEAGRSAIGIVGTPFYDSATGGTPDNVIYTGAETTTLLDT
ncbi:MAG: phage tail tube protein, partial [Leuconostoc mesenteroides]